MATIDKLVGKVAPVVKGTWDTATKYEPLDIVSLDGGSYIAKKASAGQKPATTSDYWKPLAVKGDKGDRGEIGIVSPIVTADQPTNASKGTLWMQLTNDTVGDAQRGVVAIKYYSGADKTFQMVKAHGSTLLSPGTVKTAQLEPGGINFSVMARSSLSIYGNDFLQAINTSGTGKIAGKLIQLDSTVTVKDNLNLRPVLATKIIATDIATLVKDTITNMGNWVITNAQALKETNLPIKEQGIFTIVPWNNETSGYAIFNTFTNNGRASMRYYADILQNKLGAWVEVADGSNVLKANTASTLNGVVTLNNGAISSLNHPVTKVAIGSISGDNNLWTGTSAFTIKRDNYVNVDFNITKNETPTLPIIDGKTGNPMYLRTATSAIGLRAGAIIANLVSIKASETPTGATASYETIYGEMTGYGIKYTGGNNNISLFTPALISTSGTVKAKTVTASGALTFGTIRKTSAYPARVGLTVYGKGHIDFHVMGTGVHVNVYGNWDGVSTGQNIMSERIPNSIPAPKDDIKITTTDAAGVEGVTLHRGWAGILTLHPDRSMELHLTQLKENENWDGRMNLWWDVTYDYLTV